MGMMNAPTVRESQMANFASQLKHEISILSKKEVRSEVATLKRASSNYRSEISSLKMRLASLEALMKKAAKIKVQARVVKDQSAASQIGKLRFRIAGFASLMKKLELSATDMGKILGVSSQSVYHWENGTSKPRAAQLKAIAHARTLGMREIEKRLKSTQLN